MVVKKFYGKNTRDALRRVRNQLGQDAIILSNRPVAGGIEIMAVAEADVNTLAQPQPTQPASSEEYGETNPFLEEEEDVPAQPIAPIPPATSINPPLGGDTQGTLPPVQPQTSGMPQKTARSTINRSAFTRALQKTYANVLDEASTLDAPRLEDVAPRLGPRPKPPEPFTTKTTPPPPPKPTPPPAPTVNLNDLAPIRDLAKEVKVLRGMVEGQLAGLAWNDVKKQSPERMEIFRLMLSVGLSPAVCRQLLNNMPPKEHFDEALKWVKSVLLHNFPSIQPKDDIIEAGGIYALVGPTGVGKTTTVAKLAARCTLKQGPESVALITTDAYRIGAHDQLRIYGKILGISVYMVKDERDMNLTLNDLSERHLVLIDTAGMSQRDQRLNDQMGILRCDSRPVKRLLLLSANAQGNTLDDVARRYVGDGLTGCILSKIDEALSIGSALDVMIRHKLPLHYVANGQRVPEDLHLPNPLYLIDRSFKIAQEAKAYQLSNHEYPLFMSAGFGYDNDADPLKVDI